MKEKINLYGIKSLLEIQCDSCNRKDHFISKCPFVNADFQMEKVLSNYRTECFNERKKFKRKQKKKHNAKKNIKFIQEKSKSFEISAVNYYDSSINSLFILYFFKNN